MKTLSIRNPYAYLIAYGAKDVENRTWCTDYRGPLLLHATGSAMDIVHDEWLPEPFIADLDSGVENAQTDACMLLCEDCLSHLGLDGGASASEVKKALSRNGAYISPGEIIGMVDLIDIVRDCVSQWAQPGLYHWILANPVFFETTFSGIKGKLRLWDYNIPYIPKPL